MEANSFLLALYEISMSIGNTLDLKKMLHESITTLLSRLNCSSAVICVKRGSKHELLYAKPKVLVEKELYSSLILELDEQLPKDNKRILVKEINQKQYYILELKHFGYLVLTKSGEPFQEYTLNALNNINLKLVNAIRACELHADTQENKARLSEVQSIAHLGSWTTLLPSKKHYWDDELFHIMGEEPQSFVPSYKKLLQRITPASRSAVAKAVSDVFQRKVDHYKGVSELVKKDGSIIMVEVQSRIIYDKKGKAVSLVGTTLDISKQYELEQQLREESTLLKTIIDTVPMRIFWKDTESKFMGGNKLFAEDANLENENDLMGKSDYDMPWKNVAHRIRTDDKNIINTGNEKLQYEEPQTLNDGSTRWVATSKVPLKNDEGKIVGILGAYQDITTKKENEETLKLHRDELQYQATHDLLTGLPNRMLFLDRLNQSLHKANRNQTKVAVLFIDMDRFKEINDSLGHVFGDEAIKEVARRIDSQIRKSDTVARFGGDEFVMIIDDIQDSMVIIHIVEKLMRAMTVPIVINDHTIYVSVSVGISMYPQDTQSANDLLKNADAAMYKAKDSGRNTYKFYTKDMTEKAFARIKLESHIRQAIDNNDFMLYYQPQVNALTDQIIGMEALIRWEHRTMGFIPPDEFIRVAEDTGLIISLGKWILKEGMQQMVTWYDKDLNPGVLALNLSMIQLQERGFIAMLKGLLEETGCKAKWLELEVTESQVMHNPEETILILQEMSNLGIQIAIDDFGTGYSSLSYLKRLPIDILKIDRSFITDIPYDEDDMVITQTIIGLAENLNLQVIAEGVETQEQKTYLVHHGCKYIQGYLYAKPMPSEEMKKMLIGPLPSPPFIHSYDI